jgi:hypothetical protein
MSLVLPALAVVAFLALSGGSKSSGSSSSSIPRNLVVGSYLDFPQGVIVDIGPNISPAIIESIINASVPHAQANPGLVFNIVTNNDVELTSEEQDDIMIDGVWENNLLSYFPAINEVQEALANAVYFAKTGIDPEDD